MKLTRAIYVAIFALLSASALAAPQNPIPEAQVPNLMREKADLHNHAISLMQMAMAGSSQQQDSALIVSLVTSEALAALEPLLSEAAIYHKMECDSDRLEVLSRLPLQLKFAKTQLDVGVERVNKSLTFVTNEAMVLEGRAIRDGLQLLRATLELYSYDER
jgi:hypothetical protein